MYQNLRYHNYNPTLGDLVAAGVPLFNEWWTTHVPEYKKELEKKIIHRFWFYQIGQETPDQFVHYLNQTLEEVMPYYNQLYASELIKINPMINHAMTTDHRSIENLVKDANTKTDKYSKAVRDFLEKTGTISQGGVTSGQNITNTLDKTGETVYNKHGEDTIHGEHAVSSTQGDTKETGWTEKQVTDTDTTSIDTKNLTENTTTDGTTKNTGTVTEATTWNETTDSDGSSKTDKTITSDGTSTSQQLYADTPQVALQAGTQNAQLRQDYLTNATWNNGSTHDSTTEAVTGSTTDDTTVNHTGNVTTTNDLIQTDKSTVGHTAETIDAASGTLDTTVDTTGSRYETDSRAFKEDGTQDETKEWEEHGGEKTKGHQTATQGTTAQSKTTGTQDTEAHASTTDDTAEGTSVKEDQTRTTDLGENTVMSGFMNVSSSQLLEAFRKTFLNVDRNIMDELVTCFMTIY